MCNIVSYNVCAMIKKISNKIKSFIKGDESNGRIKWSLYGRVWREVGQPYWKWLVAGIFFTVLAAAAEAYTITIVQQVVDKAFIEKSLAAIYWLGVQVIVAFGAKGAFTYAKALIMAKGGVLASANLQKKIEQNHAAMRSMYLDKIKGIITSSEYANHVLTISEEKSDFEKQIVELTEHIEQIEKTLAIHDNKKRLASQYVGTRTLSKEMVSILIDYILVGRKDPLTKETPVEIHWNF